MKGLDQYTSGTKETWRGWQWNRIVERLCGIKHIGGPGDRGPAWRRQILKNKTVLYLVGPEDADRPLALRHGFANQNVIAIDLRQDRVNAVRRNGGVAIHGSLQQIIAHWKENWSIDVIVADFCHGLTKDALALHPILMAQPAFAAGGVLAINMMRGRDADSNEIREWARNSVDFEACGFPCDERHRGVEFMLRLEYLAAKSLSLKPGEPITGPVHITATIHECLAMFCRPEIYSYVSESRHTFDSLVCRWPFHGGTGGMSATEHLQDTSAIVRSPRNISGKLAALLAVRTKRAT